MGTISARSVREKLILLSHIQAIMCIAIGQGIHIRRRKSDQPVFSESAEQVCAFVSQYSEIIEDDRPLGREIEAIAKAIADSSPPA